MLVIVATVGCAYDLARVATVAIVSIFVSPDLLAGMRVLAPANQDDGFAPTDQVAEEPDSALVCVPVAAL